jgi:predicted negative regulator of RcsB-dependent stress response
MRSTTYFWLAVAVVIAAVLIVGFEKYRAQHLRASRHHASLQLERAHGPATPDEQRYSLPPDNLSAMQGG